MDAEEGALPGKVVRDGEILRVASPGICPSTGRTGLSALICAQADLDYIWAV